MKQINKVNAITIEVKWKKSL